MLFELLSDSRNLWNLKTQKRLPATKQRLRAKNFNSIQFNRLFGVFWRAKFGLIGYSITISPLWVFYDQSHTSEYVLMSIPLPPPCWGKVGKSTTSLNPPLPMSILTVSPLLFLLHIPSSFLSFQPLLCYLYLFLLCLPVCFSYCPPFTFNLTPFRFPLPLFPPIPSASP